MLVCCIFRWFIYWTKQHKRRVLYWWILIWTTLCLLLIFVRFVQVYQGCKVYQMCVKLMQNHMKLFSTAKKLFVRRFKAKTTRSTVIPLLTLGVQRVKSVSCYKNVGIVLDIELSDDKEIQRQIRYQYEAVNKLRASFSRCSNAVKNVLFRSFCTSICASQS